MVSPPPNSCLRSLSICQETLDTLDTLDTGRAASCSTALAACYALCASESNKHNNLQIFTWNAIPKVLGKPLLNGPEKHRNPNL